MADRRHAVEWFKTMCQSPVLTDFMATTLSDARQMFRESLRSEDWQEFILSRQRAIVGLDQYSESSIQKMGNNVFKILADSGYLESGRSKKLKNVFLLPQIREWANSLDCQKVYDVMESVR
ncbi:BrxA family protein [Enterobacter hormaechei]|uniref:BrxA family protein n=1 Tax=Enterobacter hormaechei TaxID=158836 RepID=UPI001F4982A7|nr:BrxA family protein [Enterobacter hormaechei]